MPRAAKKASKKRFRRFAQAPRVFWWTRERVLNGLRRAAAELFGDDRDRLPMNFHAYAVATAAKVKGLWGPRRRYPPDGQVKRNYASMFKAWQAAGLIGADEKPRPAADRHWTRRRVDEAMRWAAVEIWDDDEKKLPTTVTLWTKAVQRFDPVPRGGSHRLLPGYKHVLRFYDSMNHAWSSLGYIVETRARRVVVKLMATHPDLHARLREVYRYQGQKRQRRPPGVPTVKELAAEFGVGHHLFCQYAARQGWVTPKEKPWTRDELKVLDKFAHLSPERIQVKMKQAGFSRTVTAIRVVRKRRNAHKGSPYYSAHALCQLLGIDHKTLERLAKAYPRELPFVMKGGARRGSAAFGGDVRLYHVKAVRAFVWAHPEEFDLRKVDKMWFLWLVSGGRVKLVASTRLGKRAEAYRPEAVREHRKWTKGGFKKKEGEKAA